MLGRITRLRVKVTSRCNLNCVFCHGEGSNEVEDKLTVEDYEFIAETCAHVGIRRFKITGGEPLLRKDIVDIVRVFSKYAEDVSLTTNGVLLDRYVRDLKRAGLHRVNISVHTLDRKKYKFLTGHDCLDKVLENVSLACEVGFQQVKVNVLVTKVNVSDIPDLIRFCKKYGMWLQLIEYMPIGRGRETFDELHVPLREVLEELLKKAEKVYTRSDIHLRPILVVDGVYIEFVMGYANPDFCRNCRQVRLTADGKLRGCIYRPLEVNVLDYVKSRKRELFLKALEEVSARWSPMFR